MNRMHGSCPKVVSWNKDELAFFPIGRADSGTPWRRQIA